MFSNEENQDAALNAVEQSNSQQHQQTAGNALGNNQTPNDGGREARIAIRKGRIEASRMAKINPENKKDGLLHVMLDNAARRTKKVEIESREAGKAKTQTILSRKKINQTREYGNEIVTNIRVGITARESIRRKEENIKAEQWANKNKEEMEQSKEASEKIELQWGKVEKLTGPYEMNQLLQDQKKACSELLEIKNNLINDYLAELKSKDDEYVRELKRQAEEIDKLLDRMESQFKAYQIALIEEAEHIERAFVEERAEMIASNLKEIENLFESRRLNETKFMNERAERIEDYVKQLELLRVNDSEEYNLVKIKLETDVQMRATYQLNTEKLEYNYQVLKKREEENGTILGAQKRKINRLADHLNSLKIKSAKQEKMFQQENTSLTDDYKHLTEQFKELQKKFRHFQLADSKKYKEVWKMNEEEAKTIMRKVLQADRIINEQQLGLEWTPPSEDLFRNVDPLFFQDNSSTVEKSIKEAETAFEDGMQNQQQSLVEKIVEPEEKKESLALKFQDHKSNTKTMKKALELLCNEAGFLVEDKLQKLLSPLHKDEQSLMRLDSIFKALDVETIEDIERLTSYFVKDDNEDDSADVQRSRTQLIVEDNATLIHPNEVVGAIRRFSDQSKKGGSSMLKKKLLLNTHDKHSELIDEHEIEELVETKSNTSLI
ncbi:hypothetical protein HK103_006455 [Boothiomyces macroporosus]|uniref:Dynein regulatory complex protein 1/2 N-terminal domain-containing protein n=1 Tax=Boothiomyces macroporosus TaxID=261099 RepID=A0AAD5UQJ4_9FUNG|nr:hypothetical protein HK103_006455 [Boothiomyces macroporosus]